LAGIGRNAGNITDTDSAAHRAGGRLTSNFHTNVVGDTSVHAVYVDCSASCGSGIAVTDPQRHEAGETGHRGRGDRRRIAAVGMNPTTGFNNNAGG